MENIFIKFINNIKAISVLNDQCQKQYELVKTIEREKLRGDVDINALDYYDAQHSELVNIRNEIKNLQKDQADLETSMIAIFKEFPSIKRVLFQSHSDLKGVVIEMADEKIKVSHE